LVFYNGSVQQFCASGPTFSNINVNLRSWIFWQEIKESQAA
jgi:hypothetical protein